MSDSLGSQDDDTIWSIIQDDLPALIPKLKKIV